MSSLGRGGVYQPTTVTYESSDGPMVHNWRNRPISFLSSSVAAAAAARRRPCGITCPPFRGAVPALLATSAVACFSMGLVMMIHGTMGYNDASDGVYLMILILGAIFFLLSIFTVVMLLRMTRRACWTHAHSKEHHLSQSGGVQALSVNPSTDLLVAAQYAPVSEVVFQPPPEDTEHSTLMPTATDGGKDSSNEDTDRMIENDPRIVLRPLNPSKVEET